MSVRVFVANDHEILRGALRAVIDMQPDMDVVGEAATGRDAELGIKETKPDIVLMDISIPNGGTLDAIAAVKRICSKARFIILTFYEELGYIRAATRRWICCEESAEYRAPAGDSSGRSGTETLVDASVELDSAQPSTWSSATGTARPTVREPQIRRSCASGPAP